MLTWRRERYFRQHTRGDGPLITAETRADPRDSFDELAVRSFEIAHDLSARIYKTRTKSFVGVLFILFFNRFIFFSPLYYFRELRGNKPARDYGNPSRQPHNTVGHINSVRNAQKERRYLRRKISALVSPQVESGRPTSHVLLPAAARSYL